MTALFLTVLVDMVGFGIVIPLLPFYAQKFGATPDLVTLTVAAYTLTQFVFAPLWGRISDRYGRRPVLLVTLAGTALSYVWTGFADSLVMLFVARAFAGACAANMAVAHAYVADVSAPEHRARDMGRIGAAFGMGFVLGPAIGGFLAGPAGAPDFGLPFWFAAGLSAVAWVLAWLRLRETTDPALRQAAAAAPRQGRLAALVAGARRPRLGRLIALAFMTPFVFSGVETTFALWSERALGWGPAENGYAYTYMGVVAVLAQGLAVGRLVRAVGERQAVLIGAATVLAGCVLLPFALSLAPLLAALGLIVFGVCITGSSLNSLISLESAAHARGATLGLGQASSGLARILGPALNGFAFVGLGRDAPYFLGAVVMVVMLVLARGIVAPARARDGEET